MPPQPSPCHITTHSHNILNYPTMSSPIHPMFKLDMEMSTNCTHTASAAIVPIPSSTCIKEADADISLTWTCSLLNDLPQVRGEQYLANVVIQWVILLVTTLLVYLFTLLQDIQHWLFELEAKESNNNTPDLAPLHPSWTFLPSTAAAAATTTTPTSSTTTSAGGSADAQRCLCCVRCHAVGHKEGQCWTMDSTVMHKYMAANRQCQHAAQAYMPRCVTTLPPLPLHMVYHLHSVDTYTTTYSPAPLPPNVYTIIADGQELHCCHHWQVFRDCCH